MCCSDHVHCCPKKTRCNLHHGSCDSADLLQSVPWFTKTEALPLESQGNTDVTLVNSEENNDIDTLEESEETVNDVICPGGHYSCPDGYTCCPQHGGHFGCCPITKVFMLWCRYSLFNSLTKISLKIIFLIEDGRIFNLVTLVFVPSLWSNLG